MEADGVNDSFALRCREAYDIAGEAQRRLIGIFNGVTGKVRVYTFKSRVKTPTSISMKVRRKREEVRKDNDQLRRAYAPEDVTDVWGCRYVTLYQSDIPPIVAQILNSIDLFNRDVPPQISLIDFVIYTNRPSKDPLSIVEDVNQALNASKIGEAHKAAIRAPENRESAYSSVHLVFSLPVSIELVGRGLTEATATFEVQVRDIFEEGWGEIQHDLIYSTKDELDRVADEDDEQWQLHLNALKTFVDGCSQHASIIKRNFDFMRRARMPSLNTKSATSRFEDKGDIVALLRDDTPMAIVDQIDRAYSLIIDAQATEVPTEARDYYLEAARRLRNAISEVGPERLRRIVKRGGRPIAYFLRIELANCLVFSDQNNRQDEAMGLYEELAADFPNDPVIMLRWSRAELNAAPEDRETLIESKKRLMRGIDAIPGDALTGPTHWLTMAALIQLSYTEWCLSKVSNGKAAELSSLLAAVSSSERVHAFWSRLPKDLKQDETYRLFEHKGISNLLFYRAKLVYLTPEDDELKELLRTNIAQLVDMKIPEYREYYKTRDNLMHAYRAVGDVINSTAFARLNQSELRKRADARAGRRVPILEVRDLLMPEERPSFENAVALLSEIDG